MKYKKYVSTLPPLFDQIAINRVTWTFRGSDNRHRYTSSLISFFIVGGWNGYFFLNYRGCVCFLGSTTQKQGLFYLSQLSHLQNLPDDRRLQRSHTYHRGLMGAKFRWRFGGRNMGETWDTHGFLGLVFKTIVGWFSFIQLVSTFCGYVFYIKWSSKSVAFLGDIFWGLDLGWYMILPRFFGIFQIFSGLFHKNYRHISDHILDM